METTTIQHRKRKRSCDMTRKELRKLEFLNRAQAAVYCEMDVKTFDSYVVAGYAIRHPRVTATGGTKFFYFREQLDTLRPKRIMEKMNYIKEQPMTSLTAKRERS